MYTGITVVLDEYLQRVVQTRDPVARVLRLFVFIALAGRRDGGRSEDAPRKNTATFR